MSGQSGSKLTQTIGFLGAGQMAQALARGFVAAGVVDGRQIVAADPVAAAVGALCRAVAGAERLASNKAVVERADVVFLAVKPQQVPSVVAEIRGHLAAG